MLLNNTVLSFNASTSISSSSSSQLQSDSARGNAGTDSETNAQALQEQSQQQQQQQQQQYLPTESHLPDFLIGSRVKNGNSVLDEVRTLKTAAQSSLSSSSSGLLSYSSTMTNSGIGDSAIFISELQRTSDPSDFDREGFRVAPKTGNNVETTVETKTETVTETDTCLNAPEEEDDIQWEEGED
jgi:hypothetical protein